MEGKYKDVDERLLESIRKNICADICQHCNLDDLDLEKIPCDRVPNLVAYIHSELEQAEKRARIELAKGFINKFCNDHNEKIRWIRSVAIDEEDLLKQILNYFEEATNDKQG